MPNYGPLRSVLEVVWNLDKRKSLVDRIQLIPFLRTNIPKNIKIKRSFCCACSAQQKLINEDRLKSSLGWKKVKRIRTLSIKSYRNKCIESRLLVYHKCTTLEQNKSLDLVTVFKMNWIDLCANVNRICFCSDECCGQNKWCI